MSVLVSREFPTTIVERNAEDGTHVFAISDPSVDSHGTSFPKNGWRFDRFINNPIVTYGHPDPNHPDPNVVIGRATVYFEGDTLMARVEYDMENPLAVTVKSKVERKFLNMASIRAYVDDGHRGISANGEDPNVFYMDEKELLDFGILMHGSNKNAMAKRDIMGALGIQDEDKIEEEADTLKPTDNTDESDNDAPQNAALLEEARALISKTFNNIKKVKK